MTSIAAIEEEKKEYQQQLDTISAALRDDPDNAELNALKDEMTSLITMLDENIAELQPKSAPKPKYTPDDKWRDDKKPTDDKDDAQVAYKVNDTVMAKWLSGDKSFYPARITSVTGSSTAPIYTVKFKSYDSTETLRGKDVRPMSNKRKADDTPSHTPSGPGVVSSSGPKVYPNPKKEPEKLPTLDDPAKPPKAKKIKAKKELEAGKNKWQEFNSKSKFGKTNKKDSMFRTPEGVNGRVGFTGSGQAMRKDQGRSRHIYQVNEDLD